MGMLPFSSLAATALPGRMAAWPGQGQGFEASEPMNHDEISYSASLQVVTLCMAIKP